MVWLPQPGRRWGTGTVLLTSVGFLGEVIQGFYRVTQVLGLKCRSKSGACGQRGSTKVSGTI